MSQDKENAIRRYKDHQIIETKGDTWTIAKVSDGGHWYTDMLTNVVCPFAPQIATIGDAGLVAFAYNDGSPRQRVSWIAKSGDSPEYLAEKATIGGTRHVYDFDITTAIDDIASHLKHLEKERSEDQDFTQEDATTFIAYLRERAEPGIAEILFWELLYEDSEIAALDLGEIHPGRRVHHDVWNAWAAIKRLHDLLATTESL